MQNTEGSLNAALTVFRDTIENVRKGLGPAAGANIAGLKAGTTTGGGNPGKKSQRRKE